MRLLDLIPLDCLCLYLVLSPARESPARNAFLRLSALAALGLGLAAVSQGRWQAWGVVAAAMLAVLQLVRAPGILGRSLIAVLIVGTGYFFWCLPALDLPRPAGPLRVA